MAGSAEDADNIRYRLDAAYWNVLRAEREVMDAVRLIRIHEPDAEHLAPSIEAIQGALDLASSALASKSADWRNYTQAREQG